MTTETTTNTGDNGDDYEHDLDTDCCFGGPPAPILDLTHGDPLETRRRQTRPAASPPEPHH